MSKKSKPTISSHRKELIKLIEKAARTTSTWNVFNVIVKQNCNKSVLKI